MVEAPGDLFSLAGKRALVTGGAQGLGRMITEGLLAAGAAVTFTSRKADACAAAEAELSAPGSCDAIVADLATPEGVRTLAAAFQERHRYCHILVNNAGRSWGAPLEEFPDHAWPEVLALNVQAPFTLVQELLPVLAASAAPDDPARVINIGSVVGRSVTLLNAYSYTASKAAIRMVSRELAAELAGRHITVNTVAPGIFPTHMTRHLWEEGEVDPQLLAAIPLGRMGRPDDIAGAVVYLASKAGAWVTGAELSVDGGRAGCA